MHFFVHYMRFCHLRLWSDHDVLLKGVWPTHTNLRFRRAMEFKAVRYVSWNLSKLLACLDRLLLFSCSSRRICCCKIYNSDNLKLCVLVFWMRLSIQSRSFCENLLVRFKDDMNFESFYLSWSYQFMGIYLDSYNS